MENNCKKCHWLAPVDPVGEGTWIFTNNFGLSACLLNFYDAPTQGLKPPEDSRGQLLRSLVPSRNLVEFEKGLLDQLRSVRYAPCQIVGIEPGLGLAYWSWNGHELISHGIQKKVGMITSSSWNSVAVTETRQRMFQQLIPSQPETEDFAAYHLSVAPEGPPYSVCMTRPDTRTVSISRISYHNERVRFTYEDREESGGFGLPELCELEIQ